MLSRGGKARVLVYIASFGGLKGDLYLKIGNGSLLCGEISRGTEAAGRTSWAALCQQPWDLPAQCIPPALLSACGGGMLRPGLVLALEPPGLGAASGLRASVVVCAQIWDETTLFWSRSQSSSTACELFRSSSYAWRSCGVHICR